MKNKLLLFIVLLLCFISSPVSAETVDCGIFAKYTRTAADIIMIAAPILLIIMGSIDFVGAVAASDEKAMKKAVNNFVKRLIICLVILILPLIINLIIGWTTLNDLTACL